jgi:hypothetical protein
MARLGSIQNNGQLFTVLLKNTANIAKRSGGVKQFLGSGILDCYIRGLYQYLRDSFRFLQLSANKVKKLFFKLGRSNL